MRLTRWGALGASLLVLLSACSTGGGAKPTVKIGSDGFYEAKLMAEIYAQALEAKGNPVCGKALKDAYGIDVGNATLLSACDTPMVQALQGGTIDVGELCSTQPDILVNGWVILEDDKHTQPADNLAPLVRNSLLTALG